MAISQPFFIELLDYQDIRIIFYTVKHFMIKKIMKIWSVQCYNVFNLLVFNI